MTKEQAQLKFYKQFMSAYPKTAVPDDVTFPYLTYEPFYGTFGEKRSVTVSMWIYTESEATANTQGRKLENAVGYSGIQIPYDNGTLWVKRGVPFLIAATDAEDKNVKLRQFNLEIECLSIN